MIVYKCSKCALFGTGVPGGDKCPNCGEEIVVKVKSPEDSCELLAGKFRTIRQINHLVEKMLENKLYESLNISLDFKMYLEKFFDHTIANLFEVDSSLLGFDTRIKGFNLDEVELTVDEELRQRVKDFNIDLKIEDVITKALESKYDSTEINIEVPEAIQIKLAEEIIDKKEEEVE